MNIKTPRLRVFFTIIWIAIGGAVGWIIALLLLWLLLNSLHVSTDFFVLVESLSTAVAAAAVISAGFVAYKELSEVANSRHVDIVNRLFEDLNSQENIEARRWIYQNLNGDPAGDIASISEEGRTAIKRVLNSLDHVAFLTQPGLVDETIVMPWMNLMIVKSWNKLCPYVEYERQRRNEPDYYQTAQHLAERCQAWRKEHLPGSEITWVKGAL